MELRIDPAADQAILTALRSGDHRQAARLMVKHHGFAVFHICRAATGSEEAAEDLTQASFARAFALLPGLSGDLTTREWLEGIARQCCAGRETPDPTGGSRTSGISESLRRRLEVLAAAL